MEFSTLLSEQGACPGEKSVEFSTLAGDLYIPTTLRAASSREVSFRLYLA